ncbi:MAG TPA: hypothetical protein V6D50_04225 [Chroococcales cyanobacterium]|jgi:hypothetical protein
MKPMNFCTKPVAIFACVLGTTGALKATATVVASATSTNATVRSQLTLSQTSHNSQVAQGLAGQCRVSAKSIFVYRERSTANPIRALEANERVSLAEVSGREGWIAISSPVRGFVETRDLTRCSRGEAPTRPLNLCRQVTYRGMEGLAIRERPESNSLRMGGVFYSQRVTLSNPPEFRQDAQGREWARLAAPMDGWISNGFPAVGDLNLEACD